MFNTAPRVSNTSLSVCSSVEIKRRESALARPPLLRAAPLLQKHNTDSNNMRRGVLHRHVCVSHTTRGVSNTVSGMYDTIPRVSNTDMGVSNTPPCVHSSFKIKRCESVCSAVEIKRRERAIPRPPLLRAAPLMRCWTLLRLCLPPLVVCVTPRGVFLHRP